MFIPLHWVVVHPITETSPLADLYVPDPERVAADLSRLDEIEAVPPPEAV